MYISGPFTARYQFGTRKRRNPDVWVTALDGQACIVPRNGNQERQEYLATLFGNAQALETLLAQAVNHAEGRGNFNLERAKDVLAAIRESRMGVSS